jgi:ubiquinone/menaquinone biosynthesis C-methylase UbiE
MACVRYVEMAADISGARGSAHILERLPMMGMLDLLYRISPRLGRGVVHAWYQTMSRIAPTTEMKFMNYGYSDLDVAAPLLTLEEEDELDRYCIQLYHHVAGAVDLRGRDVLEVGCGRGGGASYIARYLRPASMHAIDLAERAIQFCRRHHVAANLRFQTGDAERLPFVDASFDAVVNVESSHCYGSMPRFLSEVRRVLRPDGHLLIADRREHRGIGVLREQLVTAGFHLVRETRITPNILRALDLDNDRKVRKIDNGVPVLLRRAFKQFAATRGTSLYDSFREGTWEYMSFVMRKRGHGPSLSLS